MLHFITILVNLFWVVNCLSVDDAVSLFGTKHCIEASLVSIPLDQTESRIFNSPSVIEKPNVLENVLNPDKSVTTKIHELAQHNAIEFLYELVSEDGLSHAKTYKVNLILGDESYEGSGPSLKKAKQTTAALALENTFYEHPPEKLKVEENNQTPTVILNNIAAKLGMSVSYYLLNGEEEQVIDNYGAYDEPYGKSKSYFKINSTSNLLRIPVEEEQITGPFIVRAKVGGFLFKGIGHTIQAARHDAALNALKAMEQQYLFKDGVCSNEESAQECKQKKENLKSPITRIYEFAQSQNLPLEFSIVSETGKSHKKVFVTQCKLGDLVTEGEATSKKESKKVAAEKMLKMLPQAPVKFSENAILNNFSTKNKKKKKKKMNKMGKSTINDFIHSISNIASSIWSTSDDGDLAIDKFKLPKKIQKFVPKQGSPKDHIFELGGKLNVHIDFTDLSNKGSPFFSLMTLGVKPPHICLGKAATRETSHDVAALHGMKFLQKSGIFGKMEFEQDYLSADIESYELEGETEYKSIEETKKDTTSE